MTREPPAQFGVGRGQGVDIAEVVAVVPPLKRATQDPNLSVSLLTRVHRYIIGYLADDA